MKVSHRLLVIAAIFITCIITANVVAVKLVNIATFTLPAAILIFPLSYIFGDILTEVYGYHWARRVIWLGFLCNLIFVVFVWIGQILPAAPFWEGQQAYQDILGYTPRLLVASFCGYLIGEFANSFILAKMKLLTKGRWLWTRTIASTVVGEGLDSAIFIILAYFGSPIFTAIIILYHWIAKTSIEVLATPFTYVIVNYLKQKEGIDFYDDKTRFNPFVIAGQR